MEHKLNSLALRRQNDYVSKKDFWKKTLTAVAVSTITTFSYASPYDEYKDTTLVVNFPAHPHYNAVMKVLPEFTKETGIKVEVDQLQYLRMREKQTLELTKEKAITILSRTLFFQKRIMFMLTNLKT